MECTLPSISLLSWKWTNSSVSQLWSTPKVCSHTHSVFHKVIGILFWCIFIIFVFSANVISLQWNPSKTFSVNVVFVATLVGDYSTFWKLSSDRLVVFSSEMQNRKTYDFVNPRNQTILKTSLKIMSDWNNSNLKFLSSSSSSLVFPVSLLGGILILMFCFESPNFKSF